MNNIPTQAHIKIAFEGVELEMKGPVDDVYKVLTVLADKLATAFVKAKEAAPPSENKGP